MAESERDRENTKFQFLIKANRAYSQKMTSGFRVNKSQIAVLVFTKNTLSKS